MNQSVDTDDCASKPHDADPLSRRVRLAAWLEALAAVHVLFPTAIVGIALVGFLFGQQIGTGVLPLAAVVVLVPLRLFTASWRDAWPIAVLAAIVHVAAGLLAFLFPDGSWDGLAIHQEAVLRLAAGWNPVFGDAGAWGSASAIWINHYPKASWIAGAAVLQGVGYIEAGKLFNLTLAVAAGGSVMSALLRLTTLPVFLAAIVAALAALNPVSVYQGATFYVDGAMASLLTVLVAGLACFASTPHWRTLRAALPAACLAINLKFTGLVFVVVLLALTVIIVWWRHGLRAGVRMTSAAAAAGVVGVMLLGYTPYIRNTVEKGNPLYPVIGAPEIFYMSAFRPMNLNDKNRVTRFLISNFSRSEGVRPPRSTRLKFPFWIGAKELSSAYRADVESGGFGPLYGGLLLLSALILPVLIMRQSTRRSGLLVLLIAGCLCASIFVHQETWWARYIPQAWLLPLLVAVAILCSPRWSLRWWLGNVLIGVTAVNVLMVAGGAGLRKLGYARATRSCLQEMASVPEPVSVYLGPFFSLRQRLLEAGIKFRVVDAHVVDATPHVIPSPNDLALWFEPPSGQQQPAKGPQSSLE